MAHHDGDLQMVDETRLFVARLDQLFGQRMSSGGWWHEVGGIQVLC